MNFFQEKVSKDKGKKTESQKKKREKSESPEKVCGLLFVVEETGSESRQTSKLKTVVP